MRVAGAVVSLRETSDTAMKRCGLGALIWAAYQFTNDHRSAHDLAIKAMRPLYGSATLVHVNDMRGHAAVLALFDEVIAAGLSLDHVDSLRPSLLAETYSAVQFVGLG
jgi:hypothetical protein